MRELPYAVALGLTLAVELPIWALVGSWAAAVSRSRALAVGVVANVVSHPLLWFVLVPAIDGATGSIVVATVVAEVMVVLLETLVACRLLPARVVISSCLALLANASSLAIGLVVLA